MKKTAVRTMVLFIILTVAALSTSCGGPETLEEYINNNDQMKQQVIDANNLDSDDQGETKVTVKENTLSYSYTFAQTFSEKGIKELTSDLEDRVDTLSSTYSTIRTTMEKESKIKGIIVRVDFYNGDGSVIYTKDFKEK